MKNGPPLISYDTLIRQLKYEDPYIRGCAASSLGNYIHSDAAPVLREIARDKSAWVRGWVIYALGVLGNSSVVPDILAALRDSSPWVRTNAAWSILQLRESLEILASLDKDPDTGVRAFAKYARKILSTDNLQS